MTVHCKACNHEWEVHTTTPLLRQAIEVMRAAVSVGCPRCAANGKAVLVGAAPHSVALDIALGTMQSRLTLVEAEVTARKRDAKRAR